VKWSGQSIAASCSRRVGSQRARRYDAAQTRYQRLLRAGGLSDDRRGALEAQFLAVDPARLATQIGDTLDRRRP